MDCTIREYIESKCGMLDRINAINNLIDKIMLNMLDVVDNAGCATYSMDDGQMKISTDFRSVDDVLKGIRALESLKGMYMRRINGGVTYLRGGKC